jgi:amidohydrolase
LNIRNDIIANRRWFHQHPELSFQEVKTAAKIVSILRSYGISEIFENIGRTGVVALIYGTKQQSDENESKSDSVSTKNSGKGKCIALRADMDALPIQESADVEYKSQNDGVMHACGHDGHMAMLLAAAFVFQNTRSSWSGCIKLLFQPAEEGLGGAKEMILDGCLDEKFGPRVDQIYGIHLWTVHPVGAISCENGPVMASSDRFEIEVRGKGGHGK